MRNSGSENVNPLIVDWSETYCDVKDNLGFFAEAFSQLHAPGGGQMVIGLVGARDLPGWTLRQAQAALRWDLSPSQWSHAFLVADPVKPAKTKTGKAAGAGAAYATTKILEVTLHDRAGHFPEPSANGVNWGTLGDYADGRRDANVALLSVEMDEKQVKAVAARSREFNFDRVRYNFWDSLAVWQAYLWSFGQRPNPLREGYPIFSSQYIEMVFEAIGVDVTPGASERNSAPEHIWNTAKWWHKAFAELYNKKIRGYYVVRDPGCALLNAEDRTHPIPT